MIKAYMNMYFVSIFCDANTQNVQCELSLKPSQACTINALQEQFTPRSLSLFHIVIHIVYFYYLKFEKLECKNFVK